YKALFETDSNRVGFVSRLFSRKPPAGLTEKSTVDEIFSAFMDAPVDEAAFKKNLSEIKDLLLKKHRFALTAEDQEDIEHVYSVFHEFGPAINYNSGSPRNGFGRGFGMPDYATLMTADDLKGEQRSYLASEANYQVVRDLEIKNLIVPLTGDFGGSK